MIFAFECFILLVQDEQDDKLNEGNKTALSSVLFCIINSPLVFHTLVWHSQPFHAMPSKFSESISCERAGESD